MLGMLVCCVCVAGGCGKHWLLAVAAATAAASKVSVVVWKANGGSCGFGSGRVWVLWLLYAIPETLCSPLVGSCHTLCCAKSTSLCCPPTPPSPSSLPLQSALQPASQSQIDYDKDAWSFTFIIGGNWNSIAIRNSERSQRQTSALRDGIKFTITLRWIIEELSFHWEKDTTLNK